MQLTPELPDISRLLEASGKTWGNSADSELCFRYGCQGLEDGIGSCKTLEEACGASRQIFQPIGLDRKFLNLHVSTQGSRCFQSFHAKTSFAAAVVRQLSPSTICSLSSLQMIFQLPQPVLTLGIWESAGTGGQDWTNQDGAWFST